MTVTIGTTVKLYIISSVSLGKLVRTRMNIGAETLSGTFFDGGHVNMLLKRTSFAVNKFKNEDVSQNTRYDVEMSCSAASRIE